MFLCEMYAWILIEFTVSFSSKKIITEYSDSESDSSSLERKRTTDGYSKINRKPQGHKRMRKKRVAIPVQPPKIPPPGTYPEGSGGLPMMYQKLKNDRNLNSDKETLHEDESSVSSPRENSSPIVSKNKIQNKMETPK
jgi:hypothetical protein